MSFGIENKIVNYGKLFHQKVISAILHSILNLPKTMQLANKNSRDKGLIKHPRVWF